MFDSEYVDLLQKTIYTTACKYLKAGSSLIVVKEVLSKMGFASTWMNTLKSNISHLNKALPYVSHGVSRDKRCAAGWSMQLNTSFVILIVLDRYLVTKEETRHLTHIGFVLPSKPEDKYLAIGAGGVRSKSSIISTSKIHFLYYPQNIDYIAYYKYGMKEALTW